MNRLRTLLAIERIREEERVNTINGEFDDTSVLSRLRRPKNVQTTNVALGYGATFDTVRRSPHI